ACVHEFEAQIEREGTSAGDFFTRPLATLPGLRPTLREYMGMPENGYDRPFFMAHGIGDQDVPIPMTARYAAVLGANRQPVTFRTYPTDHSGTMRASLPDTIPYVRELFR